MSVVVINSIQVQGELVTAEGTVDGVVATATVEIAKLNEQDTPLAQQTLLAQAMAATIRMSGTNLALTGTVTI